MARSNAHYEYQRSGRYFAQMAQDLEEPATAEITSLGATAVKPGFKGLYFSAESAVLYRIIYEARLLTRVLAPLDTFRCDNREDLYRWAVSHKWPDFFDVKQTFAVVANVNGNAHLTHSKFAALCLKDGIVDSFRRHGGRRPDVNTADPDLLLNLFIERDKAIISLDASGGSLHRRGYRRQTIAAPMQETLAAAVIYHTQWEGDVPLCDPLCGSGTLLCEAFMKQCRVPAGYLRSDSGLRFLPDYDPDLWRRVKAAADARIRSMPRGLIGGSDIDPVAVRVAGINCGLLPGGEAIAIERKDFVDLPELKDRVIVCNPPYGIRMGRDSRLEVFYKNLGDFLKQRCRGSRAFIYFGNREMIKKIGLKPSWKKPLANSGLEGRLVKYELY